VAVTGHKTATIALGLLLVVPAAGAASDELVGPPAPEPRFVALRLAERPISARREAAFDVAWMAGAAGFELATKVYALDRCSSCYEANPLARAADGGVEISKAVLLKAAATAGVGALCYKFHREGHHRKAKLARWIVVGVWITAGAVNLVQAHR
jgi:hypothetical protein